MIDLNSAILILIFILIPLLLVLLLDIKRENLQIEKEVREGGVELKNQALMIKNLKERIEKHKQELRGIDKQQVLEEMNKISRLWKSRRERLRGNYWERIKEKPYELAHLQDEKKSIEELIKKTKTKYHRREIDEESFREIVKDYQKKLLEINLQIAELEEKGST